MARRANLTQRSERFGRRDKNRRTARIALEPFRQGELDSLCGLYAVINAMYALCPELDEQLAETIFRKLVIVLGDHVQRPMGALYDGLGQPALESLLDVAARELKRELKVNIRVAPYEYRPEKLALGKIWDDLRQRLSRKQVAILGLSGADEHWTVAYALTGKVMRLFDSSEHQILRRSRCTVSRARTRFRIDPEAVILVRRGK